MVQCSSRVIPKDFKNGIHSFPDWRSAFREGCGEQAGKIACCVLGQGTKRDTPTFMWKTGGPDTLEMAIPKPVRTSRPKYSNAIRFLENGGKINFHVVNVVSDETLN